MVPRCPGDRRTRTHHISPGGPCMARGPVGRGEVSLHLHWSLLFSPSPKVQTFKFSHLGGSSVGRITGWFMKTQVGYTHCPYSPQPLQQDPASAKWRRHQNSWVVGRSRVTGYGRSLLPPVGRLGVSTPAPRSLAKGLFHS